MYMCVYKNIYACMYVCMYVYIYIYMYSWTLRVCPNPAAGAPSLAALTVGLLLYAPQMLLASLSRLFEVLGLHGLRFQANGCRCMLLCRLVRLGSVPGVSRGLGLIGR